MAVPSARNSGLERMSNVQPGRELASRIVRIDLESRRVSRADGVASAGTHSAVRHGTVDFSTTILELVETSAIRRVASSMKLRRERVSLRGPCTRAPAKLT